MAETPAHKRAKRRAAGGTGRTEAKLPSGKRLDAKTSIKATEVERGGSEAALRKAARRLKESGVRQKVLQVPQKDMKKAAEAMRREGVSGTVKNMGGTKRTSVRKKS